MTEWEDCSGWKGPACISITSCSKQGWHWIQNRLLRSVSSWILENPKDGDGTTLLYCNSTLGHNLSCAFGSQHWQSAVGCSQSHPLCLLKQLQFHSLSLWGKGSSLTIFMATSELSLMMRSDEHWAERTIHGHPPELLPGPTGREAWPHPCWIS